ncbi:MAG: DUF6491 family protein [Xanthomonadales bacterium]|nr:DUF6491 family protein [Xanthomonadales bacterium]
MNKTLTVLAVMLPLYISGCATQEEKVAISLDSDPRIGDEVKQVCFARNVDSWSDVDNDRNAVVLRMKNRDYYKLKLSGGCDPQWAMMNLALITRGGSNCYTRGDRVKTDGDAFRGYASACVITQINKWDPDAVKKADQHKKDEQQTE